MVSATHSGTRSCGRRSTPISSPASARRFMPRSPRTLSVEPGRRRSPGRGCAAEIAHHWTRPGEIEAALGGLGAGGRGGRADVCHPGGAPAVRAGARALGSGGRARAHHRAATLGAAGRAADASGSPGMKRAVALARAALESQNSSMTMPRAALGRGAPGQLPVGRGRFRWRASGRSPSGGPARRPAKRRRTALARSAPRVGCS